MRVLEEVNPVTPEQQAEWDGVRNLVQSDTAQSPESSFQDPGWNDGNPKGYDELNTELEVYPNPFNPAATVRFRLDEQAEIDLSIYDVSGRLVRSLVNKELSEGVHHYTFNLESLPTGVYVSRLVADNRVTSRLISLVK